MNQTPPTPSGLPKVISDRLLSYDRSRRRVLALRGLAETILVFCVGIVALVILEAAFRPSHLWRVVLSGMLYLGVAGWLLGRTGLPLIQRRPLRQVAWDFETAAGNHFQERIVSAVELAQSYPQDQPGVSSWMVGRTIQLAAEELAAANPRGLVNRKPALLAWKRTAICMLVMGGLCLIPGISSRLVLALNPSAPTLVLTRIQLVVTPGNTRLRQGTPLEIRATGHDLPERLRTQIKWADGFQETVSMQRTATNEFAFSLPSVAQGFRYSVIAGDGESAVFTVKVDVPPRIARMQLQVEPPAYSQRTNSIVEGGSADFLVGSKVHILMETADELIADAEWLSEQMEPRKFQAGNNRLQLEVQPTNLVTYQVRLTGVNKLQSIPVQKWILRPLADQPPIARLLAVGAEPGLVQHDELLPFQITATDDVGLKTLDLLVLSRDSAASVTNLFVSAPNCAQREFKAPLNFNLSDLKTESGEEVQLQLVATDLCGQITKSEAISFTVGTADKALEAQLAARLKLFLSAMAAQVELLQQTRSSWLSITRNYRDNDPAAQFPALTVLKSRLREFGMEMDAIGQRLIHESETNNVAEARFMYRLGSTISAWGGQQREVLLNNCAQVELARSTNRFEHFTLGRELFSRAILDLEQYQRVVAVLQGAMETDVLATRCLSAQARYKRGLPVLRGDNVVAPLGQTGSGLMARFYDDIDLHGKVLEQKVANPRFDEYVPANKRENWSCRYEGEIHLNEAGDWLLACVADDGVRLLLDGSSVLPKESWSPHPATQYKADLKLNAGWHPVVIEFFQGTANSKLQFLAARPGQPLQEVPVQWLRPPPAREPSSLVTSNAALAPLVQTALRERVRGSLALPAEVPRVVAPFTNVVPNETLRRLVQDKLPVREALLTNLATFASWTPEQSREPEGRADDLTGTAHAAHRILREELEKYRWRYEGAAALKQIQNAIDELREITHDLRRLPWHQGKTQTEEEQAKAQLAKAWQQELKRATAEAAHEYFETAKQKEATLAQRATALAATEKIEREMQPAVEQLAEVVEQDRDKDGLAGAIEQQLNGISNRYRELNDMQEKINREDIAAQARKALPPARAFARAQVTQDAAATQESYKQMHAPVREVLKALRVAGDYGEAQRLQGNAGDSAQNAKGKETSRQLRDLATRTDNNFPSLAKSIPPPMNEQSRALEKNDADGQSAAQVLARPRLGMSLESARLARQGDRQTAAAYGLLGQDLQSLLNSPDQLSSPALQPLADRAAALAGERGEQARQAEVRKAQERLRQLAGEQPQNPEALASRLEDASALAKQAAGEAPKRQPLVLELAELSQMGTQTPNWADATDPGDIAAGAASEAASEIQSGPERWESYSSASEMLSEAARQIRSDAAAAELAGLNPFPMPPTPGEAQIDGAAADPDAKGNQEGPAGKAILQGAPKGLDQAEWAKLTERLRQAIRSSGIENFSPEHQAAIRAYFQRLSSDTPPSTP